MGFFELFFELFLVFRWYGVGINGGKLVLVWDECGDLVCGVFG